MGPTPNLRAATSHTRIRRNAHRSVDSGQELAHGRLVRVTPGGLYFDLCTSAQAYTGVQFTIAGDKGTCALELQVQTNSDKPVDTMGRKGTCSTGCVTPSAKALVVTGTAPQPISVPFSSLMGGAPNPFDLHEIVGLQWQLTSPTSCTADITIGRHRLDDEREEPAALPARLARESTAARGRGDPVVGHAAARRLVVRKRSGPGGGRDLHSYGGPVGEASSSRPRPVSLAPCLFNLARERSRAPGLESMPATLEPRTRSCRRAHTDTRPTPAAPRRTSSLPGGRAVTPCRGAARLGYDGSHPGRDPERPTIVRTLEGFSGGTARRSDSAAAARVLRPARIALSNGVS